MSSQPRSPIAILQQFSIPLIAGVLTAFAWANLDPRGYQQAIHFAPLGDGVLTLHFFANELLMVFFFGIATKEITESCLPGGALNPLRRAINPLLGTLGGVIGPALVYTLVVSSQNEHGLLRGWGVPTATDIALAWLAARVVFGHKHPAVSFLLLLAVADDGIGLAIIAVFYPDPAHPVVPGWLGLVALAMASAYGLKRAGVIRYLPYLGCGALSWLGLFFGHLHPALALVPIVPFMPHAARDKGLFAVGEELRHDTMNRFEHVFKRPVDFGLFVFGLTNAGVELSAMGVATAGVLIGLLVGKTAGITTFSLAAARFGFPLPKGMTPRSLFVAGVTAGMGLTVALFVAGVAFVEPEMQASAKMGALFSSVAAPLAWLAGKLLRVKEEAPASHGGGAA